MKTGAIVLLVFLSAVCGRNSAAGDSGKFKYYKQPLTTAARHCLEDVLKTGNWRHSPKSHKKMVSVAVFAQVNLGERIRKQYIYVMKDSGFCGTAGCSMLIAEARNGDCHEIYDGHGSELSITVLRKRDHGHRRLLAPCELRFDGREYQQIHDECPNANVRR